MAIIDGLIALVVVLAFVWIIVQAMVRKGIISTDSVLMRVLGDIFSGNIFMPRDEKKEASMRREQIWTENRTAI